MLKHLRKRWITSTLILSLFAGTQPIQNPFVIKAETATNISSVQENQNVTSGSAINSVTTTTQSAILNELDLPVKNEQITMQLRCKEEVSKKLTVSLDETMQNVLTGAGITTLSWRIVSGSGVVTIEETASY